MLAGWIHVKLNYIRVIKPRVSPRVRSRAYNRGRAGEGVMLPSPPPLLPGIRFTSGRIRVTLNDLFDPVGRTYICKMPLVLRVTRREGARIPARVSGFAYSAPGACANPDSARGSNGPSARITSAANLPACDRYYDIIGQCGSRAGRKVKPISNRSARSRNLKSRNGRFE